MIPLVIDFSHSLPNIQKILKSNEVILDHSPDIKKEIINKTYVSFRRQENLKDILVHKKHNKLFYRQKHGTDICHKKKCALCPYMKKSVQFQDNQGKVYSTKGEINCTTENVIYGVQCEKCNKLVYVGETMNSLYKRHLQNFSRIRNNENLDDFTYHFTNANGHSLYDYSIIGIEKIFKEDSFRKTREQFWIKKLNTLKPNGLNTRSS